MPIGVCINVVAVFIGTMIGGSIKKILPQKLIDELPKVFGICSVTIGIMSVVGVQTLPVVIMATIIGFAIGEMINIHHYVSHAFSIVLKKLPFHIEGNYDEYMELYLLVVLMFSMSGTGLFGALSEGMSGDSSVLLSKSVLDFFTAILFGAALGYAQSLICVPQLIILMTCFLLAHAIAPFINAVMIADFKACGGIITMMTGLTVARVMKVRAINLVPALIVVMPLVGFYYMFI
jgi:uncharacterized membrane protein YqgA involved in biofilm formation